MPALPDELCLKKHSLDNPFSIKKGSQLYLLRTITDLSVPWEQPPCDMILIFLLPDFRSMKPTPPFLFPVILHIHLKLMKHRHLSSMCDFELIDYIVYVKIHIVNIFFCESFFYFGFFPLSIGIKIRNSITQEHISMAKIQNMQEFV